MSKSRKPSTAAQLILFNKPFQVLSQFKSDDGKLSLKDFLDTPQCKDFYPAGRLDFDSEGLLLLTNHGPLQHRIAHPDKKLSKHYWVQVEGKPEVKDLAKLREGIELKDGKTRPAKVKIIPEPELWPRNPPIRFRKNLETTWLEIVINEGKNRQVRRMCGAVGYPCLRLVRFRIGTWELGKLQPGEFFLTQVNLAS